MAERERMMSSAKPQVIGLFPTPIMHVPGVIQGFLLGQIVERIRAEHRQTNSADALLSHTTMVSAEGDPLFQQAGQKMLPHISEFGALLFGEQLNWKIKEIWVNVLDTGGHQAMHNHANSFVSGIVYLTPHHPGSGTVFHKALGGGSYTFVNQNERSQPGPFSAARWQTPQMSPGDMVLFPSFLLHEVPKNQGEQRITMAYNAVPNRLDSWGYALNFS
ncbi:MAG: TIGR02466 family protein [Pikeienuella sp.]